MSILKNAQLTFLINISSRKIIFEFQWRQGPYFSIDLMRFQIFAKQQNTRITFHGFKSKKYKKNIRIFIRGLQEEVDCESCSATRLNSDSYNFSFQKNKFDFRKKEFLN